MAVIKQPQTSRLDIKVENGIGAAGQTLYKTRIIKNLKTSATDEDVYAVGSALAALQSHSVESVSRVDDAILISQ